MIDLIFKQFYLIIFFQQKILRISFIYPRLYEKIKILTKVKDKLIKVCKNQRLLKQDFMIIQ